MEGNNKNILDEIEKNAYEIAPALKDLFDELRRHGVDMTMINAQSEELGNITERLYKVREFLIELPEELQERIEEMARSEEEQDEIDRKMLSNELDRLTGKDSSYKKVIFLLVLLVIAGGVGGFCALQKNKNEKREAKQAVIDSKNEFKQREHRIKLELLEKCAGQKIKILNALRDCKATKNQQMPRKIKK